MIDNYFQQTHSWFKGKDFEWVPCPSCDEKMVRIYIPPKLYQCKKCDLVRLPEQPTQGTLDKFYEKSVPMSS